MMRALLMVAVAMAMSVVASLPAVAHAEWPSRPLRFIVTFAAGSGPDIICRVLTDRLSQALGQRAIVDDRPGGGNLIGTQAAARAPADGYNFLFATSASLVTHQFTFKTLPYDPERDFVPVALIGRAPLLILATPTLPAHTLADLVALDKAKPGKLSFASDGPRNFSGLLGAWLNKIAGMKLVQVPYAVMPQGVQDTIAGRTQIVILSVAASGPLIKSGRLRPLAVSSARRLAAYDDVAAVAETFPGFEFTGWFGIVAPTGTPTEAVQRVNRELDRILREPEVRERLEEFGLYTDGTEAPQGFAAFIQNERQRRRTIVAEIGIEPE